MNHFLLPGSWKQHGAVWRWSCQRTEEQGKAGPSLCSSVGLLPTSQELLCAPISWSNNNSAKEQNVISPQTLIEEGVQDGSALRRLLAADGFSVQTLGVHLGWSNRTFSLLSAALWWRCCFQTCCQTVECLLSCLFTSWPRKPGRCGSHEWCWRISFLKNKKQPPKSSRWTQGQGFFLLCSDLPILPVWCCWAASSSQDAEGVRTQLSHPSRLPLCHLPGDHGSGTPPFSYQACIGSRNHLTKGKLLN